MADRIPCVMHWSGGKDSALAFWYCLQNPQLEIRYLATTITAEYNRVSMHGLRYELLVEQAKSIGIKLYPIHLPEMPDMETYDNAIQKHYENWKREGVEQVVFGDIFLEDLRIYRENQLAKAGLNAVFPLWKRNTHDLLSEFLQLGFKTIIICAQERFAHFTGKILDEELVKTFPDEVDVCGENGEFHTFVFEGPVFMRPIIFKVGEIVLKSYLSPKRKDECSKPISGFFYIDLLAID